MTARLFSLVLVVNLLSVCANASQEKFPFVATITSDHINVRAGQSANFERLCQLNKNDEAVVVARSFGWSKIKLPSTAKSYVSAKYVQVVNGLGTVTADRVNIRAEANFNSTILGQVRQGDKVQVIERVKDWYKIIPIEESYGWVADKYIKFKSYDLATYHNSL